MVNSDISTPPDIIRRKNFLVANVIGMVIIGVVVGSFAGAVWLMLG